MKEELRELRIEIPEIIIKLSEEQVVRIPGFVINVPYEKINFKLIEEVVLRAVKNIGVKIMGAVIKIVDEEEYRVHDKSLESTGKKSYGKYVKTPFGSLLYARRRYKYKEKGKSGYRYLADEKLVINKRVTDSPGMEKREIEAAVENGSYRKAAREVDRWVGEHRSHESIRQKLLKQGGKIKEQTKKAIKAKELEAIKCKGNAAGENTSKTEAGSEIMYTESDSVWLKFQGRCNRDKRGGKKRRGIEVKIGIKYSGHEARYKSGNGKQKKLKERFGYISLASADEFMKEFSILCGRDNVEQVIIGGDGASWIKKSGRDYFGEQSAYVLCAYHLNKIVKRVLWHDKRQEKCIRGLLKKAEVDKALKKLREMIKNTKAVSREDVKKLKGIRELITYIDNNRDGIGTIEKLKEKADPQLRKVIRNTGAMEGNGDKFVAQRMKGNGRSWSERGADSMLQVICKMKNNEWEDCWLKQRNDAIEVDEEAYNELLQAPTFWRNTDYQKPSTATVGIPVLHGPDQGKTWAGVIREMQN